MKYIPVFGDQLLFNDVSDKAVIVIKNNNSKYVITENESSDCFHLSLCQPDTYIAMRRIIKEPKRWTWEDKKAGRLPEVGSFIMEVESQYGFEFVGVCAGSKRFAVKDVLDGLIYFYNKDVISPIETPAEKAQRERDEWIDNACSFICFYDIGRVDAIKSLEITYDKLKSGELSMPVKDGE